MTHARGDDSPKIMQPRVWIVIPSFNGLTETRRGLADLQRQSYRHITAVVSDSGSTDGTYQIVAKEFPPVIILRGTRLGGGRRQPMKV
jgi:glycosyltransferase involved in cell wall biosynthesis